MRTMRNVVAVLAVSGVVLFSSQSAQACHGRKGCFRCGAKRYAAGYGYAGAGIGYGTGYGYGQSYGYGTGYGYGQSYGYSPNYSYPYNYPYGWGSNTGSSGKSSDGESSSSSVSTALSDRLNLLDGRIDDTNQRLSEFRTAQTATDAKLTGLIEGLDKRQKDFEKTVNDAFTEQKKSEADTKKQFKDLNDKLDEVLKKLASAAAPATDSKEKSQQAK